MDKHAAEHEASHPDHEATAASPAQMLRRQAEARLLKKNARSPENREALSPEASRQMLHELQVHQIELEMQNEELRASQAALDAARARYFDLYDLAPVGYCTVSEQGLIMHANLTAAGLLGVARAALVGKPLSQFIIKADQDLYYLHRKKLLASGEAQLCELRMVKNDGSQCWVHLAATVARDADGTPELRTVITDVTERKRANESQQASDAKLNGLVFSILDAIIAIDANHRITLFNPAAERMFGRSADEMLGSSLERLIPSRFRSAHSDHIHRYGVTKVSMRSMGEPGELFGLHADGSEFPIDASISQLEVNGEKMFTVMLRDVSEREQLYQMLQERNVAIEAARSVAEAANRAKSEFLSSMSHELRTPLNAILGFAQLMENSTPPPIPAQKVRIEQILRAGWYLLELVNEILDLSLIESGKLALSMEAVPLAGVMLECQAMMEPQAQKRGVRITFPPFDTPCFVEGDRTRVKQVLVNLLSNAIKYNKVGGTVVVDCVTSIPGRVRIRVTDTGAGLPAEQVAQLFQPFNRLGKEHSTEEGTGIGLAMSKRLVELMNGAIGVESTAGAGSMFWIELSLPPESQPCAVAGARAAVTPPQVHADAPLQTLLCVEDNPANLALVEELIKRRPGIRFLSAVDGNLGVAMARSSRPDVILMDINLPGIGGVQALRILREDPATAHIPVVALSANVMPRDIEEGLEAGFFRYLTKPVKLGEFLETVDVALHFARTQAARAEKNQPA
jgi:PAS domain S-box-containing protein